MKSHSDLRYGTISQAIRDLILQIVSTHSVATVPLAYLITFSCYGTRLHGHGIGSVDKEHNVFGGAPVTPCRARVSAIRKSMRWKPFRLETVPRQIVFQGIVRACDEKGWIPLAAHVRSNHAHGVIHALADPGRVLKVLKRYATHELNQQCGIVVQKVWAERGSKKHLWNVETVEAAIRYVLFGQGVPMACYPNVASVYPR